MGTTKEHPPYFVEPEQAPRFIQMAGVETTVLTGLHGEQMMMVLNTIIPGHSAPTHSHPHEQVGVILSGRAILCVGDEEQEVGPGNFYSVPGGVPHSATPLGSDPFVMLDVFYPVREDFLARCQTPAQDSGGGP